VALLNVESGFSVKFWGVRGSIPSPGPATLKYGGNTSCVEMRCGRHLLIFDAGSGLRELGRELMAGGPVEADLFLSHTHYDHLAGLPFFMPAFEPRNRFRVWAGHLAPERTIEAVLRTFMAEPLFPVPLDIFHAQMTFQDFRAGETLSPRPGVTIRTAALNHPNRATGYRVEFAGKSACYVTDNEHTDGVVDPAIMDLVTGTDLLIYDATFTDDEYPRYKGWGHSTWQEGVRLAKQARVKTVALFHHEPTHDDAMLDEVARDAAREFPGAIVAREGATLDP
jgi:phosphoribosyl 1,2-cyclic phosphodiesterase